MMELTLLWATLFLSLIYSNVSVTYRASRRIYTQDSTSALCTDYIEVTFDFDNTTNNVDITIFSSTNTSWFSVGFPDPSIYYDKSKRKTDVMNGYALMFLSDTVAEYTITGTNNIMDGITEHFQQNIAIDNIVNSAGTVTITLHRNLTTQNGNDFQFDLVSYLDCYPFLMTVAIGDGLLFTGTDNTFGSSYLYIYDSALLADTSTYNQNWIVSLQPDDITPATNVAVVVSLAMDPTLDIVSVTVADGPHDPSFKQRSWALSFPDLADTAYYHPADLDPIGMESDYAVIWGDVTAASDSTACDFVFGLNPDYYESRVPVNGAECVALLPPHTDCWNELPNQKWSNGGQTEDSYTFTYTFDLEFKSCGYEFNPYEYQTCRPLTMVAMATHQNNYCFSTTEELDGTHTLYHHTWDKIQIDDFDTRAPTFSPTSAPSAPPTAAPSLAPSAAPTWSPVSPTESPTDITDTPTLAPSATPTAKPSDLPTKFQIIYDDPPCDALQVKHLDTLFSDAQAHEEFNEDDTYYNGRRTWDNGRGLIIHFVTRFEDDGDWVITNGSYSAISISDANIDNDLVYNTSDPDEESPNALPGPYPNGYIYYDHFPHDNILFKPDSEKTLYFECYNTSYPTLDPSPMPTTAIPTPGPTTLVPTMAPTANCSGLCIEEIKKDDCDGQIAESFMGCYNKQEDYYGKGQWNGVESVSGFTLFYNLFHEMWEIDAPDYAALTNGTHMYPPGLFDLPFTAEWMVFDKDAPFDVLCNIHFKYNCYGTAKPTFDPTQSPTTAIPTTAEPTADPTIAPTSAPTVPPSIAPSLAPTLAPTGSPVADCKGFGLTGTDVLDGLYRQEVNESIADRYYWQQVHGDSAIFWSDSVLHERWVIYSASYQRLWLSQDRPYFQPPLESTWDLHLGASPFVEDSKILELECFATLPPTPAPTESPSDSPTNAPTAVPSDAPSDSPSAAPSDAPTTNPTPSPTTLSPTMEPTFEPTFNPTEDPTAEPCDFMVITVDTDIPIVDKYNGVYVDIGSERWQQSLTDGSGWFYIMANDGSNWQISTNDGSSVTLQFPGTMHRPPYNADGWHFTTDPQKLNYSLNIECSMTNVPSTDPTNAPTAAPTAAPTSSCYGLYFMNEDDVDFRFNGWYRRQNNYKINNHRYWTSGDLASIEYLNGAWYLMEFDNDISDDEDPVMVTHEGADFLSPPSGVWLYAYENDVEQATITITCSATRPPSTEPSSSPTMEPTLYIMPSWEYCDDRPYFTVITDANTGVYWREPVLSDHLYPINVVITPDVATGDDIELGMHIIEYTATDTKNITIECNVTVYVVAGIYWNSTYDYCVRHSVSFDIRFNDSYHEIADDQEESDDTIKQIEGVVYDPRLQLDGQACYVHATQISKYATINIDESPDTSSFFGFQAVTLMWEIFVLLFVVMLFCLYAECFYKLYKEKKAANDARANEQTENLLSSQQLSIPQDEAPVNDGDDGEDRVDGGSGNIELQEPKEPVEAPDDD